MQCNHCNVLHPLSFAITFQVSQTIRFLVAQVVGLTLLRAFRVLGMNQRKAIFGLTCLAAIKILHDARTQKRGGSLSKLARHFSIADKKTPAIKSRGDPLTKGLGSWEGFSVFNKASQVYLTVTQARKLCINRGLPFFCFEEKDAK